METITIPKENFDALLNLARTAVALNENFIPKINYGASTIPAAGFTALNEFGIARSTVESLEILKIK
ncbi:TPA: hypothetical protein WI392_000989 [Neisseria meningitidis]